MLDLSTLHRRARRVLPECLRTSTVLVGADAGEAGLAALLLPLRHVRRGSLWFRLAPETVDRLRREPQACLQDALRAREGLGRHRAPLLYRPWWAMASAPWPWFATASRDGRVRLWLLPVQGLAIYAWDDRAGPGCGVEAEPAR